MARLCSLSKSAIPALLQTTASPSIVAFDLLEANGANLRLRMLLQRGVVGIHFNDHLEADGATVFTHACKLGCEGIFSKDRMRPYQSGRSETEIKNPAAPGVSLASRSAMRQRRVLARLLRRIPKKPPALSVRRSRAQQRRA